MGISERGDREWRRIREAQQRGLKEGLQALRKGKETLRDKVTEKAQSKALEVMSEEVKVLYVQTLAAQSLVGGQADPKKIADIYLFMSQIDLQPGGRMQVRQFLEAGEAGPSKVLELASKTVVKARSSRDEIAFSLVKDLVRVSRVGGGPSQSERESIVEIAVEFGYEADKAISLAENAIEQDEAFVEGEVTIGELEKRTKQLAAQAASIGVPIAAVYVSGSVVGLSAAGITSGLAWLMGIVPATVEMVIRGWRLCESYEKEESPELTKAKTASMLMLGHTMSVSGNLIKTGAIYGMNPLALNWAQALWMFPVTVSWLRESVKRDQKIRTMVDAEWASIYLTHSALPGI